MVLDKLATVGDGQKNPASPRPRAARQHVRARVRGHPHRGAPRQDRGVPPARSRTASRLDDLLPEAFALVREASKRTLGQRHYDVQVIGAAVLHQGDIAEMRTGEGKTLVSTMPAYLNALEGKGVHVVTVNDYLAKRDSRVDGADLPAARRLGRADPGEHVRPSSGGRATRPDITYGTNNEFGFDYLRDNMAMRAEEMVQRGHFYAIVDEVDSILIDEARTPLIISGMVADSAKWYQVFARIAPRLRRDQDYEVDEAKHTVAVLESGIDRVEAELGLDNLYDEINTPLVHHLQNAIRAKELYKRDVDYIVRERRGADRRRVHRPRPGGPALLRGPAPGDRGEGGRADQGGEPDPRHHHDPELLPHVRPAGRHDGHRADAGARVRGGLQALRGRDPDQPPDGPRRRAGRRSTRPRRPSGRR